MPGLDGYEACRRLKSDPQTRDAAVIFLSSLDDARDKVRGLEAGAVDFVTKPFQAEEVVARVNTHLTLERLRRQLEARNADLARELAVAQQLLSDARSRVEGPLVGSSPAVRALRESIAREAAVGASRCCLTGPVDSGHESTARAIHHASPRGDQAFIHVNCGLLPRRRPAAARPRGGARRQPPAPEPGGAGGAGHAVPGGGAAAAGASSRSAWPGCSTRRSRSASGARRRGPTRAWSRRARRRSRPPRSSRSCSRRSSGASCACRRSPSGRRTCPSSRATSCASYARRVGSVVEGLSESSLERLARYRWPGGVRELQSLLERAVASAREPVLEIDPALLDEGFPLGLVSPPREGRVRGHGRGLAGPAPAARAAVRDQARAPRAPRRARPGPGDRALPARGSRDREARLAAHRAPVRLRRERRGQPLLRDGAARRARPPHARRAVRAPAAGARGRRPAAGLPVARRGPPGGAAAPRREAPERAAVPPGPRVRRREGGRLRPGPLGRRRRGPDHGRGRGDGHARVHAARAGPRGAGRRALRHLRARGRRVLPADRAGPVRRRADGRDDPPRPHAPAGPVLARAGAPGPRGGRARLPGEGPRAPPGHGARAVAAARRGRAGGALDARARRGLVARARAGPGRRRRGRLERRDGPAPREEGTTAWRP